jgi:hypothetical protein
VKKDRLNGLNSLKPGAVRKSDGELNRLNRLNGLKSAAVPNSDGGKKGLNRLETAPAKTG